MENRTETDLYYFPGAVQDTMVEVAFQPLRFFGSL